MVSMKSFKNRGGERERSHHIGSTISRYFQICLCQNFLLFVPQVVIMILHISLHWNATRFAPIDNTRTETPILKWREFICVINQPDERFQVMILPKDQPIDKLFKHKCIEIAFVRCRMSICKS